MATKIYDDCELCHGDGHQRDYAADEMSKEECPLCAMRARAEIAEKKAWRYERIAEEWRNKAAISECEKLDAERNSRTWKSYSDRLDERITWLERENKEAHVTREASTAAAQKAMLERDVKEHERVELVARVCDLMDERDSARRALAEQYEKRKRALVALRFARGQRDNCAVWAGTWFDSYIASKRSEESEVDRRAAVAGLDSVKAALNSLGVSDDYNGWDRLTTAGRVIKLGKQRDAARNWARAWKSLAHLLFDWLPDTRLLQHASSRRKACAKERKAWGK